MKLKFTDQVAIQDFTFAVGVNQLEIDLPVLAAGDAFFLRGVKYCLDAASAAPSVTGAGLTIFSMALVGDEQVSPAGLLSLDRLLWSCFQSVGTIGAAQLYVNNEWSQLVQSPVQSGMIYPVVPAKQFFLFGHTVNITNAATTVLNVRIRYDIVTLSASEQLAYLL